MNKGPVSMGVAFRHDLLRVSLVSRLLYCLYKIKIIYIKRKKGGDFFFFFLWLEVLNEFF